MDFCIENFSPYFCVIFSAPVIIPRELNSESFQMGVNIEHFTEVISILREMFREELKPVFEKLKGVEKRGFQFFMEAVISRCMKVSEKKTTYVHFLLVCTLINGIISHYFETEECFFIPTLCSCCLESVYNKCYKDYFDSKKKGETLDFHIGALKNLFAAQKSLSKKRNLPMFRENKINVVLKRLMNFDDVDYALDKCEKQMLKEVLSRTPYDFSLRLFKSETPTCGDINTEDAMEFVARPEDSSESTSKTFESSSGRDVNTEDEVHVSKHEDSSESTSEQSESSSSINMNTEDAVKCISKPDNSSESISDPSESTTCKDINSEDAMEFVTVPDQASESTRKLSESEPSSSGTSDAEDSKKTIPLKKDYSYYKNKRCTECERNCANLMVALIEHFLEKCQK